MKKIVFGCGLVVLVLAVLGGASMYFFVYRPAKAFVTSMAQLGEVVDLDKQVSNRQAFTAPGDGTLSATQVQRFVAVQQTIDSRLGARAKEFETKYKAMSEREQPGSITEVVGAYRDLFGIIAEAKRAQVDALNAQRFSVDEYGWVKHRFYEAAGVALTGVDFRELAEQMKEGNFGALQKKDDTTTMTTDTPGVGIPDANRTLVAPYKEKLNAWMVYGAFGL
ncbi:MAG TPA: hypothetical protein VMF13_14230 [Luteitalea sp.]|nr:hypothetical protein [Luteitalea sp.]